MARVSASASPATKRGSRVRFVFLGAAALATAPVAHAATPNPDRPSISMSGRLVGTNTLELESGIGWAPGTLGLPLLFKYNAADRAEFRFGGDPLGAPAGTPALHASFKVPLVAKPNAGVAGYVGSAVPLAGEDWGAYLAFLGTFAVNAWTLQLNAGVALEAAGGQLGVGGLPMVVLVSPPPFGKCGLYLEGAATLSEGATAPAFDAGGSCLVTDSLMADLAFGYALDVEQPFVNVGITTNFGVLSRSRR